MTEGGDLDLRPEEPFEGGDEPAVARRRSEKEYLLRMPDPSSRDPREVVLGDRVDRCGEHFLARETLPEEHLDILFHEDGASVGGDRRGDAEHRVSHVFDGVTKLLGLFLDEGSRPGGADVVHPRIAHESVHHAYILRVLAADLEDRVDGRVLLGGGRAVGGDLVDDEVCADDPPDHLPPGSRCPRPEKFDLHALAVGPVTYRTEQTLHRFDRIPQRLPVGIENDALRSVGEDRLRARRADVYPDEDLEPFR